MSFHGRAESIRGDSHIDRNLPVQDASGQIVTDRYAIAVVADGHGGEKYIRSNIGSSMAVEVSIRTIGEYLDNWDKFNERLKNDTDSILMTLGNSIIANWHSAIEEYNVSNPLNRAESEYINKLKDEGKIIKDWETMYGTTLVISVISDYFAFGIQIGDGNYIVMDDAGRVFMPMPEDEMCVGNRTTSLCNPKASEYIRYYCGPPSVASLVCTDGFETSFVSEDSFKKQCASMIDMVRGENIDASWNKIREDMILRSKSNNRDDVSVAMVFKHSHLRKSGIKTDKRKMRGYKRLMKH